MRMHPLLASAGATSWPDLRVVHLLDPASFVAPAPRAHRFLGDRRVRTLAALCTWNEERLASQANLGYASQETITEAVSAVRREVCRLAGDPHALSTRSWSPPAPNDEIVREAEQLAYENRATLAPWHAALWRARVPAGLAEELVLARSVHQEVDVVRRILDRRPNVHWRKATSWNYDLLDISIHGTRSTSELSVKRRCSHQSVRQRVRALRAYAQWLQLPLPHLAGALAHVHALESCRGSIWTCEHEPIGSPDLAEDTRISPYALRAVASRLGLNPNAPDQGTAFANDDRERSSAIR